MDFIIVVVALAGVVWMILQAGKCADQCSRCKGTANCKKRHKK